MGIIIAIVNQKGRVGKSTTAVNLAASLTAINKKCLLVDCDPQGNATTGLGVDRSRLESGLYDFILASGTEEYVLSKTSMSGLALMGSTNDLVGAEVEAEIHFPDRSHKIEMTQTNELGLSWGTFNVGQAPVGGTVIIDIKVRYNGVEGEIQTSFVVWL